MSYDATNIGEGSVAARRNYVRFLIGDTDTSDEEVSDDTIDSIVSLNNDVIRESAAQVCEHLAAKWARKADFQTGKARVNASQRSQAYLRMADRIRQTTPTGIRTTGMTKADKDAYKDNDTLVQPAFRRGVHDFPGSADADSYDDEEDC